VLSENEQFQPGDIVGVQQGKISHKTFGAAQVMVVTDQAAVLGNMPAGSEDDKKIKGYETVSFIGQVRTKVRGKVQAGDWIIASGDDDGTGVAVASEDIGLEHQIVGRAWESSSNTEIKRVNTVVGLDQSEAIMQVIKSQENRIRSQEKRNQEQQMEIETLRQMIMEMKQDKIETSISKPAGR
jgi:hypothetical protein